VRWGVRRVHQQWSSILDSSNRFSRVPLIRPERERRVNQQKGWWEREVGCVVKKSVNVTVMCYLIVTEWTLFWPLEERFFFCNESTSFTVILSSSQNIRKRKVDQQKKYIWSKS
jgi:hypothetical protein